MTKNLEADAPGLAGLRRRFWSRLRQLGMIGERELIRVHQIAQQQRIAPEEAAVALGVITERQVRELRMGVPGE